MITPPKSTGKDPAIKRKSVKNWLNGVVTAFDDGRTPLDGLKNAGNVYLTQDGTVRPRPSLVRYGPQPTGKVLGAVDEFKVVNGLTSTNWLICMQSFSVSASPSASQSPSSSASPSSSISSSPSPSISPSASQSLSPSASLSPSSSTSSSPSASISPSSSRSPSSSLSPSSSASRSISPSASLSPSSSASGSPSASLSPSASTSPSSSSSASPSAPVTGYAQIFIARGEDTTWTACSGKYYNDEASAHYFQIGAKVVIMNGVDSLSYLDIPTSTIIPFTALATPAAPTLSANNVGTGTVGTITYRLTENSTVGETASSPALSTTVDTDRDLWKPPSAGGTDNIVITLPAAASGVKSRNIYMGTVTGSEYLIASGLPAAITTFTDDGTFVQDTTRLFPTTDSTAGPKVSTGTVINGRAFLVGDANHPYYVWNGGDPNFELDFSPANGGGFSLVGNGSKDVPIVVKSFRDGKGTPQITVLCEGTNGRGKRFIMTPDTVTLGSTVINFYDVQEDSGQDGTESPDGTVLYGTDLHYPSRDGFKTTGTLPSIQNVLSSRRTSNTIQPDLKNINNAQMHKCVGLGFEGRIYWALPVNSDSNNEIWILDLDRKGAWMKPWSIAADWMWLYNDNSGNTHHLIMSKNVIYDLSYSALTTDDGKAILTSGQSGEIYFSDDKRMWAQLLQVIIVLASPQGEMNWQITGKTEDNALQALGDPTTFMPSVNTTIAGWGEVNRYRPSWGANRWSGVRLVPISSSSATQEIVIEVDEEVQWATYSWSTSKVGVDYNVSDVVYEYIETGVKDLA